MLEGNVDVESIVFRSGVRIRGLEVILRDMGTWHGYVGVQRGGVIVVPAELRQRLHLDEPGAQVEITARPDGVLEMRPSLPVPADQAWFRTEYWQQREREVDEHVAAGRVTVHDSTTDFLDYLDGVADDDHDRAG